MWLQKYKIFLLICFNNIVVMGELKCEVLKDGIQFGQSNGLHFVTTYSLDSRLMAKCGRMAWKNSNSTRNVYSRVTKMDEKSFRNPLLQDTALIWTTLEDLSDADKRRRFFLLIGNHYRKRSMVVIEDPKETSEVERVTDLISDAANATNDNLMFYLHFGSNWYIVINIKNTVKAIVHPLNVTQEFKALPVNWDLQGLTLTDITGGQREICDQ